MELRRFFINENLNDRTEFEIFGDEFNHITKVLRFKVGYKLIVCCGDGIDVYAEIKSISNNSILCAIDKREKNLNETTKEITLFFALAKQENTDVIVQKAIELGVKKIQPFINEYSQKETKIARLNKISMEASKQCGRAYNVQLEKVLPFNSLLEELKKYDVALMGYEKENLINFSNLDKNLFNNKKIAVIIGSEGGFSVEESEILKNIGVQTFSLGRRILRADTAAVAILTLIMNEAKEMCL